MRNVWIYFAGVMGLGIIGWLIDGKPMRPEDTGLGILIWLLGPMIVSFLIRWRSGEGWKSFGWQPRLKGNGWWYLISFLVYPVIVMIILGLGQVVGTINCPPIRPTPGQVIPIFLSMLIPQLIQNVFEESGVRGYLTPQLLESGMSPAKAHVITGLIWGFWHLPFFAVITTYTTESLLTVIPRFLVGIVAVSFIFGEIRRRTNSVWPSIVTQTIGGATVGTFLALDIQVSQLKAVFFPTTDGLLFILLSAILGYFLLTWKPRMKESSE